MPSVMVLGGEAFWRWVGHEDGTLMNGISAFIKESPQIHPASAHKWGDNEKPVVCNPEEGPHYKLQTNHAGTLILDQPPELWTIFFCSL